MPYVTAGRQNAAPIVSYYDDHGSGAPDVVNRPLLDFLA